ncbi:MAG: dephospho-CoA kinase [Eubacteriales bacterium]|nr:dephospho-CoA kinase [Eubacteriales bacterium]
MFIIGITGGIGSGKSSFARLLAEAGLPVLDADKISHSVTATGGASIAAIRETFGPEFIREDGSLDRQRMADLAFSDKKALDRLSAIVHQDVFSSMEESLADFSRQKLSAVVLDVPIPVEHGFLDRVDLVVCVWTDEEIRIPRLVDRGMSEEEARRRIAVQMTKDDYLNISDYFIQNNGSLEDLRCKAQSFLMEVLEDRGIKFKALC